MKDLDKLLTMEFIYIGKYVLDSLGTDNDELLSFARKYANTVVDEMDKFNISGIKEDELIKKVRSLFTDPKKIYLAYIQSGDDAFKYMIEESRDRIRKALEG